MKERSSNFELLRIVSIVGIVFHHFSVYEGFSYSELTFGTMYLFFIRTLGKIGVVVFVLISGYFLVTAKELKISKIIKLWLQLEFYSVISYILSVLVGSTSFDFQECIQAFLPASNETWWFASVYFVLYLLSPFINRLLRILSQREYLTLLIIETVLWSIISIVTLREFQSNNLILFVYYYTIGGYIRLYKNELKVNHKKDVVIFALSAIILYATRIILELLVKKGVSIENYVAAVHRMNSPFIMAVAISMFVLFKNFDIKNSKVINTVASAAFGVYLIHDYPTIRNLIWQELFQGGKYQNSLYIIPYSIAVCLCVYVVCTLIDLARINLLEKHYMKLVYKLEPKAHRAVGRIITAIDKVLP